MHVAMDEEGTPVEEEAPGDDIAAGTDMHEPMEMGGTLPEAGREGSDTDAATHEHMEWGGGRGNRRRGNLGLDDHCHLSFWMARLHTNYMTNTCVLMSL